MGGALDEDAGKTRAVRSKPPFSSSRERRLWGWALAVVVAIYATLGLAGTLARALRESGLLAVAFGLCFLLAVVAIAASTLRRRPGRREIWVGLGVAVAYGMVLVRMGVTAEERTHLFEYGLVAVLIHRALEERRANGRRVPAPAVLAVIAAALLGWIDEGIQAVLPNRVYDPLDAGTNALAALMAVTASEALRWARRRATSEEPSRDRPPGPSR